MPEPSQERGLRDRDERKLVERIRRRDAGALCALFRRYYPRVHHFAMRRLRHPKRADAVASDVFFEVWRSVEAFNDEASVSSWIFGIAHFKCVAHKSARQRAAESKEIAMAGRCPEGVLTLIPWYRELDSDDRGIVEAHAAGCRACRSEVEMVSGGAVPPTPYPDRDASFSRLMNRIEGAERHGRDAPQRERRWRIAAALAAILLLLAVGVSIAQLPWFRTPIRAAISVSAAPPATSIEVAFREGVSARQIDDLLFSVGAVVVSGPSTSGRFRVAIPLGIDPRYVANLLLAESREHPEGIASFAEPVYH